MVEALLLLHLEIHVTLYSVFSPPSKGIDEDPVTSSANCMLVPYWAERLGKKKFRAWQVCKRGGDLYCELAGERVKSAERAALYMEGHFYLP